MDLAHLHGFPAWEAEVFELLKANFGEVQSIFAQYAKSGGDAEAAKGAMTMQQTELTAFAVDCCVETPEFSMGRVINVFERADKVDTNLSPNLPIPPRSLTLPPAIFSDHLIQFSLYSFRSTPSRRAAQRRARATARSSCTSSARRSSSSLSSGPTRRLATQEP